MPESNRPDWLWTPSTRVGRKFHYHGGTYYQARAYIERLEAQYIRDCEQITNLWERLGDYRSRIKELETESNARMESIRALRDERTNLGIQIMELEEKLEAAKLFLEGHRP